MFSWLKKHRQHKQSISKVEALHGLAIRYVTERKDDNDDVIGRGGSLSIRDGQLIVFSSSDVIFRSYVAETQASQLLSGDGTVITAPDILRGGEVRTIIAYYVYHRK